MAIHPDLGMHPSRLALGMAYFYRYLATKKVAVDAALDKAIVSTMPETDQVRARSWPLILYSNMLTPTTTAESPRACRVSHVDVRT